MTYSQERTATMKALKRCTKCGHQDAYTIIGKSYCADCLEKRKQKGYRSINHAKYHKELREERKQNGLCPECGKKPEPGRIMCKRCSNKSNRRKQRAEGINLPRGDNGFCWCCNKSLAIPGMKVCQTCYDRLVIMRMTAVEKSKLSRQKNGHPWEVAGYEQRRD